MSIVRYRQWPTQSEIHQLLSPLLETVTNSTASAWLPAVDIREEANRFVVMADLPGVDPASIDVQMEKGVLTISGQRSTPELAEGQRLTRSERGQGSFNRRFVLPDSADAEGQREALKKYTLDLTERARQGKLDPVIGRDDEIRRAIQVLQGQPSA